MIRGDARLESSVDENLLIRADLEDTSTAIANVEIVIAIERQSGGDPHPFDVGLNVAGSVDAVHISFVAAGNKQVARQIKRETRRVHNVGHKRRDGAFRRDLVY